MLEMSEREKFLMDLQGFLHVKDFLSTEEVRILNEAVDANVDELLGITGQAARPN